MVQGFSSWGRDSRSAGQQIPEISWKPKVNSSFHYTSPLSSVLSQVTPANTFTPSFSKIHFNIVLPYIPNAPLLAPYLLRPTFCKYFSVPPFALPGFTLPNNARWRIKHAHNAFFPMPLLVTVFKSKYSVQRFISKHTKTNERTCQVLNH
jgi:hypothetical protein